MARLSLVGRPNYDSNSSASRAGNHSTREIRKARRPESAQIHDRGDYILPQSSVMGLTRPNLQAMDRPHTNNDPRWFIGAGGITTDEVILIGAVQVSQGSWMPILQLSRFVF